MSTLEDAEGYKNLPTGIFSESGRKPCAVVFVFLHFSQPLPWALANIIWKRKAILAMTRTLSLTRRVAFIARLRATKKQV